MSPNYLGDRLKTIMRRTIYLKFIFFRILLFSVMIFGFLGPTQIQSQENRTKALELYAQGGLYDAQNDVINAIKLYREALQYDPNSPEIHTALGLAYYRVNQRDQSLKHAQTAVKLDPKSTEAWLTLGRCQIDLIKYLPARKAFEKVVTLEPRNIEAHIALSQIADRLNDQETFLRQLEILSK